MLVVLGTAACGGDSGAAAGSGVDRVTYVTGFGISGRESYVHTAMAKGFFREAGIEVTVQPGQAGPFNETAVGSGRAQFAAVDTSGAFVRFVKTPAGQRRVHTVAAVQQRTLLSMVTLDDRNIRVAKDLAGKRLGVGPGAAPRVMWPLYARLAGVNPGSVRFVESKPDALAGLLVAGKVDAIGLFVAGVPQVEAAEARLAAEQGRPPRQVVKLPYSDVLTDLYGTVLITSNTLLEQDPDLVRRFTAALMKGLQYAVEHPQEAGRILHEYDAKQDPVTAAAELELMKPYSVPPAGRPYGSMSEAQVARTLALLKNLPELQNLPVPVDAPQELVAFEVVPR
ncbi:ABC transporter substrate-binding protein [Actinoplanes sp. NPDC089786]|uniref:ABC transporter substrate-binding protein n=1 Tax=Actinoplanes sp. NPDC089786 TaxID=3155185 RepID=UPI003446F660